MDNNRTLTLLGALSATELTALGKYLQSPFFTQKKFLYPLFLELRESGPKALKPGRQMFFRVFDKERYMEIEQDKDRRGRAWNHALSDLNACIEDFLAVSYGMADPDLYRRATIAAFHARENESLFQQAFANVLKTRPGDGVRKETTEAWHLRFWARKHAHTYPLANRFKSAPGALDDLDADIDTYYYISKLQIACNRVAAPQVFNRDYEPEPVRQVLARAAAADPLEKSALLTLYRVLLQLLLGDKQVGFETFFDTLKNRGPALDRQELEYLVRFGLSYCIGEYKDGSARALDDYCRLHVWSDELHVWTGVVAEELLLNNGIMFAKSKNITLLDNFLKGVKQVLPEDRREAAVQLLLASRQFYKEDYIGAIGALETFVTRFERYRLQYYSLLIRCRYEWMVIEGGDSEALEQTLDNFNSFLDRHDEFSGRLRQSNRELTWFVRQLVKVRFQRKPPKGELLSEIEKRQPALREWIADAIGRLPD